MQKQTATNVKRALKKVATPERAKTNAWFFKTGKGEYGEGDRFIGVTMPQMRRIAKQYRNLSFPEVEVLLRSPMHEHRMAGVIILVEQYKCGNGQEQKAVVRQYLKNIKYINNWDLVDVSCPYILGDHYLHNGEEEKLTALARSKDLWKKRIGMISTFAFIRAGKLDLTTQIAEILLHDTHDLIHKAVGWMLREVGKKDKKVLVTFLEKHANKMPRTALRYSIERMTQVERKKWLIWKK